MSTAASSFYVTGGTLQFDAPCYVERQADRELFDGLLKGEFCYVLTSRQMGKSSLMVRTSHKLRVKGSNLVALDLTAIGQNLTPEQWYDGLVLRLGRQLKIEDELDEFWKKNERLSPVQRFFSAIRDVAMVKNPGPLVVFVDEIDTVRSLPFSTDEFFSAIRECYNRRAEEEEFNRLTFCLLGVATPSDLIRDSRITPFNIGRRIELHDFTPGEAAPLANGLNREPLAAAKLLERVVYWTNGHPYLTQRLCQSVANEPSVNGAAGVDRMCEALFLSNRARERDDNLLFVRERLLRSDVDLASLLSLYEQVRAGKRVNDEEGNRVVGILRLSGVVRPTSGHLTMRNRIYARVFDRRWLIANMPDQELRRQQEAFRKGILRGVASATVLVLIGVYLTQWIKQRIERLQTSLAIQDLGAAYSGIKSYEDSAIIKTDVRMEGARVTTSGTVSMALEMPNKLKLRIQTELGIGETDVQIVCDGTNLAIHLPLSKEYMIKPAPTSLPAIFDDVESIPHVDIPEPLYQLIAGGRTREVLAKSARNVKLLRREEMSDRKTYVLRWEGYPRLPTPGKEDSENPGMSRVPVTAWVDAESGFLRQMTLDYSGIVTNTWMPSLSGLGFRLVTLKELVQTATYTGIKLNPEFHLEQFAFVPPPESKLVEVFEVTRRAATRPRPENKPQWDRTTLGELIPARARNARPELIDLSKYYNAPLTESWHSDRGGNNLAPLPRGLQTIGGTEFDVRGIVQLASQAVGYLRDFYPEKIEGIPVNRNCQNLNFLFGTGWPMADGTHIGSIVVRYANGEQRIKPILYGFDVRDWWPQGGEPDTTNGAVVAWRGTNDAARQYNGSIRLYKTTWPNPLPNLEINAIDFVSTMTDSAPFLIGVTAE